jgi:hypothetical protein
MSTISAPRTAFAMRVDRVCETAGEVPPRNTARNLAAMAGAAELLRERESLSRPGEARGNAASLRSALRGFGTALAACIVAVEGEMAPAMVRRLALELVYGDARPDDGWADPIAEGVDAFLSDDARV